MLKELRKLLPGFTVTHHGGILYDAKKGGFHIPMMITKGENLETIARAVIESWEEASC